MADFADLATSLVATAPSPATSGTSLAVDAGEGSRFDQDVPFYATVHPDGQLPTIDNAEIVSVTAVSTDTFTITRAQLGTTAKSIETGWRISASIYAHDIDERTVGPSSSTDNAIARFDGTTGKIIQNSGVTVSDRPEIEITDSVSGGKLHISHLSGISKNNTSFTIKASSSEDVSDPAEIGGKIVLFQRSSTNGAGVTITGSNGDFGGNGNGGSVTLSPGAKSGTGTDGSIRLNNPSGYTLVFDNTAMSVDRTLTYPDRDVDLSSGGTFAENSHTHTESDITDLDKSALQFDVAQTAHGLSVGDVIRSSGTDGQYAKAQADSEANAEVVGVVTAVTDANNFTMATSGKIDVAAAVPNETAGTVLFLSPTTAGALTATEPTTDGQISKPVAVVTTANSEMQMLNMRGVEIAGGTEFSKTTDANGWEVLDNGVWKEYTKMFTGGSVSSLGSLTNAIVFSSQNLPVGVTKGDVYALTGAGVDSSGGSGYVWYTDVNASTSSSTVLNVGVRNITSATLTESSLICAVRLIER